LDLLNDRASVRERFGYARWLVVSRRWFGRRFDALVPSPDAIVGVDNASMRRRQQSGTARYVQARKGSLDGEESSAASGPAPRRVHVGLG